MYYNKLFDKDVMFFDGSSKTSSSNIESSSRNDSISFEEEEKSILFLKTNFSSYQMMKLNWNYFLILYYQN